MFSSYLHPGIIKSTYTELQLENKILLARNFQRESCDEKRVFSMKSSYLHSGNLHSAWSTLNRITKRDSTGWLSIGNEKLNLSCMYTAQIEL